MTIPACAKQAGAATTASTTRVPIKHAMDTGNASGAPMAWVTLVSAAQAGAALTAIMRLDAMATPAVGMVRVLPMEGATQALVAQGGVAPSVELRSIY